MAEDEVRAHAQVIETGRAITIPGRTSGRRKRIQKAAESLATTSVGGSSPGKWVGPAVMGFNVHGVIHPPYDPETLHRYVENSNSLRQNIDGYATNIEGFGFHFEPLINLDSDDAREKVADAIYLDRLLRGDGGDPINVREPTEDEIDDEIVRLRRQMRIERARLEAFFNYCTVEISFTTMRCRTRVDQETTGNAYWEVIRSADGQPRQIVYMPAHTVRLVARDEERVPTTQRVQKGPITFIDESVKRSFRRFVQAADSNTKPVWFKEFGDPRTVSAATGRPYRTVEEMREEEGDEVQEANEVMHFVVHSPVSPYGIPRWIGNLLSVLGSRKAEEVNYTYFDNKTIPPLVITVSGGRMNSDSISRIKSYIESEIKGIRNYHKVLILEAESPGIAAQLGMENGGHCRIEIKPLTDAHNKDALFQQYDERNMHKVGMSFRMPQILRGDIRELNRASAQAALEFAESQVFGPERVQTDFVINRMLLPALKVDYWQFITDGPRITDPAEMAGIVTQLVTAGVLTPKDARALVSDRVIYRDLPRIDADWPEQPIALTIAGFGIDTADDDTIPTPGGAGPTLPGGTEGANLGKLPNGVDAGAATGDNGGAPQRRGASSATRSGTESSSASLGTAVPAGKSAVQKERLQRQARALLRLRDALAEAEAREAGVAFQKAAEKAPEAPPEVIRMSALEFRDRFGIEIGDAEE
jgi:PBSX family phage portal protein